MLVNNKNYKIKTPNGWESFKGIRKIESRQVMKITFSNGTYLTCTLDHKLKTEFCFKEASMLSLSDLIQTDSEWISVVSFDILDEKQDVYDLVETGDTNSYYTNQILSHNCDFIGSSGTLISGAALRQLFHEEPIQQLDNLFQYERPVKDHHYVMICDVSEGKGLDYSAFSIIDVTELPYKQVCVFRDNWTGPMEYASFIYQMAKAYNDAYVLVESNNMGGEVSNILWYEYEYDTMFFTENGGRNGRKISSGFGGRRTEVGIKTTVSVKAVGCSTLKLLVESKKLIIPDYKTIAELHSFSKKGKSYAAENGSNDDLVMGLVLFAWMTNQSFFKDLTDINTLTQIRERSQQRLEEETAPFAYYDDGMDDHLNPPDINDEQF